MALYTGSSSDTLIIGTSGADTLMVNRMVAGTVDLGDGIDTVSFLAPQVGGPVFRNIESLYGSSGADTIFIDSWGHSIGGGFIDGGAGLDTLMLMRDSSAVTTTLSVANIETIIGSPLDDHLVLTAPLTNGVVNLLSGNDVLQLSNGGNSLSEWWVETVLGGNGDDLVTQMHPLVRSSFDLGAGNDLLSLGGGLSSVTLANVETLIGSNGADAVTFTTGLSGAVVNLLGGSDIVQLGGNSNIATFYWTETILGSSGADQLSIARPISTGALIDLGAGTDAVSLPNGTNSFTLHNVESIIGGSGTDVLYVSGGSQIQLGGGQHYLTLGDGADRVILTPTSGTTNLTAFATGLDKIDLSAFALGSYTALTNRFQIVFDGSFYNYYDQGQSGSPLLLHVVNLLGPGDFIL